MDKLFLMLIFSFHCSNIKVATPFNVDSESITSHFTYFDSTGRTMVILEKSNVVKEHELPIQVRSHQMRKTTNISY